MHEIDKYENRRLRERALKRYVTEHDIQTWVENGEEVRVTDKVTAEDITRNVLLNIWVRKETAKPPAQRVNVQRLAQWIRDK